MRLLVVALVAGMMATGGFLLLNPTQAPPAEATDERVAQVGGGTVTYSSALQPGERFLKQVPVPDHLANRYEPDGEEEVPGDGHDDELLVTQRRHTDHSWWTKPVTGRVDLEGIHGSPGSPICICDTEFVLSNETEEDDAFINVFDSSYILIDNVTVYGGQLGLNNVHHVTVSRSQFFNANIGTFFYSSQDILIWDNDFSQAEGPMAPMRTDPILYTPTGIDECWPNPTCRFAGVGQAGVGIGWTIMWNYFETGGPLGFAFGYSDFHIEHNTLMQPRGLVGGYHGDNYVGWNLMRGLGNSGIRIGASGGGTTLVENNSVVLNFELAPLSEVTSQEPGVSVWNDCICTLRYNDFVGYGTRIPVFAQKGGSPALHNMKGHVTANDNYWGTIHDPTLPEERWIRTDSSATTIVDRWFTEPIHPVTPLAYPLNDQDLDRWMEEAPERIPRTQQQLENWIDNGCEFSAIHLCEVPDDLEPREARDHRMLFQSHK